MSRPCIGCYHLPRVQVCSEGSGQRHKDPLSVHCLSPVRTDLMPIRIHSFILSTFITIPSRSDSEAFPA